MKRKPQLAPRLLQSIEPDPRLSWWEDGSFRKYALSFFTKNRWRLPEWVSGEYDDMLSEAYLYFLETCRRYHFAVERKHLMRLYSMVMMSKVTELSYRGTLDRACKSTEKASDSMNLFDENEVGGFDDDQKHASQVPFDELGAMLHLPLSNQSSFEQMETVVNLTSLSKEAVSLLKILLDDSVEFGKEVRDSMRPRTGKEASRPRETTNERFCRLVGADPNKVDLAYELRWCLGAFG